MAIIKCKMCGGELNLTEGSSTAECEYCGTLQTIPQLDDEKKLIQFERAERLRKQCEFDKAAGIYETIVADFRQEAEAYWGLVLCKYGIEYVDDPGSGKKIPTCHRSSFDSIMEDSDFEQVLENADVMARRVYREEAKTIDEIRKGIISVSSNEQPYDIFICYKETDETGNRTLDSVLAQDVYDALTDKGYRVFFSRITLEDKLGVEYEPYIFAALNSAKIMLAFGTDYEYFNAVWVKNEWSRFLKMMVKDKEKHLIPCYKGIDAYDMPKEFAKLQAQDLGKVGAIQDLLRGIEKLLPRQTEAPTIVQERVVVGGSGGDNKIASLLDRGNMALEDGDWAKADSFFEDVLNNDSKNAQAYIGKTLAQEKCRTIDAFIRKRKDLTQNAPSEKKYIPADNAHIQNAKTQYHLPGYVEQHNIQKLYEFDLSYQSQVSKRRQQYQDEQSFWANHRLLSRAEKFATGAVLENLQREKNALLNALSDRIKNAEASEAAAMKNVQTRYEAHLRKADEEAAALFHAGEERKERQYRSLVRSSNNDKDVKQLNETAAKLDAFGDYLDSKQAAAVCRQRIKEIEAQQEEERARQRQLAEQRAAERKAQIKKYVILSGIAAVILAVVIILVNTIWLPASHYKKAEKFLAEGNTTEAMFTFGKAKGYKDAQERSLALWSQYISHSTISNQRDIYLIHEDGTISMHGDSEGKKEKAKTWKDIVSISDGGPHVVGLKSNGRVVACGYNQNGNGECNVGSWKNIVMISAAHGITLGLKSDGTVVAKGYNGDGERNVSGWENIICVAAGDSHSVGLKADGTVVSAGSNSYRQRNVDSWTDIVSVCAGMSHTVGLRADGTVVAAGGNDNGQCNVGNWKDIIAIDASSDTTVGLRADGTVVTAGEDKISENWTNIVAVNAGAECIMALDANGKVYTTGSGTWESIKVPVSERASSQQNAFNAANEENYAKATALEESGDIFGALQAYRQLGHYRDAATRYRSIVDATFPKSTIGTGRAHIAALTTKGTVIATGTKDNDRCNVSGWNDMVSILVVNGQTFGLKQDGTVLSTGYNEDGQCDVSSWENIVALAGSNFHTVGIKDDGTVVAAGWNKNGQCNVSEWTDIVAVSAADWNTVGLKKDGTVVAVGSNNAGECNVSEWKNVIAICAAPANTFGLTADGKVLVAGNNDLGQHDACNWTDIVAISASAGQIVGLRADGTVVAAGNNDYEQCAVESWKNVVAVETFNAHVVGLCADGTVLAAGMNESGQCNVSEWKGITKIALSIFGTMGLTKDGTVVYTGFPMKDFDLRLSIYSDIQQP